MDPDPRRGAADRLAAAGCVAAPEEAAELVALAPDTAALESFVRRREQGEPLAWITGQIRFCGRPVHVARHVFVPRAQSEGLARRAAALLPRGGAAADLCTGSGAIALHLAAAHPAAAVVATDVDEAAVACARRNGVAVVASDLGDGLRGGSFDVVTAIAPYVPSGEVVFLPADVQRYEPRAALDGGDDGLDVVRRVVVSAARLLRSGGALLVEVGGDQDDLIAPFLATCGFDLRRRLIDDDGDLRGIEASRLPPGRLGHPRG